MASAIAAAWGEEEGDILAFLPGVGEIERVRERLADRLPQALVLPLHGQCEPAAQRAAIRRDTEGRRRIVLSTVAALTLFTVRMARLRGRITAERGRTILEALRALPEKIDRVLGQNEAIRDIARMYRFAPNFLYLGRGYNFPTALEGALKLKEISYIHAEGLPAAEMKHGPIALIDANMPVVVVAPSDGVYGKVLSNVQEVKARGGEVIAVVTEGNEEIREMVDHVIEVPATIDMLTPILTTIPLQLLAYHIAVMRGCNVDMPRNLAKSVTVE